MTVNNSKILATRVSPGIYKIVAKMAQKQYRTTAAMVRILIEESVKRRMTKLSKER